LDLAKEWFTRRREERESRNVSQRSFAFASCFAKETLNISSLAGMTNKRLVQTLPKFAPLAKNSV
jgi:hypothetical protein